MGPVYAEIELINGVDIALARKHHIGYEDVKKITVTALVNSGSYKLMINENIKEYLQLPAVGKAKVQLATGEIIECDVVSFVELRFKNRETTCRAIVLPGDAEVLMGSIPLQDLDVLIDPVRQELIVHPDRPDMAQTR